MREQLLLARVLFPFDLFQHTHVSGKLIDFLSPLLCLHLTFLVHSESGVDLGLELGAQP